MSPRMLFALACAAAVAAGPGSAGAQSYPARPIRLIVPYGPGASADAMGRLVAQKMSEDLGQPVVVENRAGASGMIGADVVAKSAPDGYTILLATDATHGGNAHLMKAPPFHPLRDSTPITMAAKNLLVLVASPSLPASSVRELVDHAKRNPGKLAYGSSGNGSPHHLAGVLFNQLAGTDIAHVAYKGGAPAVTDLLGGTIPLVYASYVTVAGQIRAGKLRALGVTEKARVPSLPAIPAIAETLPEFEMQSWLAFVGPAGLSAPVLARLHQSIARGLTAPDVVARLADGGLIVVANTPEQFAAQMKADYEKRGQLIRQHNITGD
ncbi:MAG: tripartite tricarboxylate transporter substrate binding protein [Burkholderiales bacterium]|nr:tripartite tricarboxylate transporter substrate binding protein [Burkholderiales bacterium]